MIHTKPIHLTVIQPLPTAQVPDRRAEQPCFEGSAHTNCHALVNPDRQDVKWNKDYSAWSVRDCRWWDDSSYIAYQGDDNWNPCEIWE